MHTLVSGGVRSKLQERQTGARRGSVRILPLIAGHPEESDSSEYQLAWRLCSRSVSGSAPGTASRSCATLS